MRVLFLNHNVRGRGTYVRAFHLARELVRGGHAVTLVTTSASTRLHAREDETDGVRVIEMPDLWWGPARTGWDPYNTIRRMHRLGDMQVDLVHAFDSRPAVIMPALRVARASGAPLVMDWADWWGRGGRIEERSGWLVRTFFGPVETWFEEAFRKRAVGATVICSALAGRLADLGFPADRVMHLPNGCPPVTDLPTRAAARAALGIAPDTPLLLHVGVIMQPDLALLQRAFEMARARLPTLRLVLVGCTSRDVKAPAAAGFDQTGFVTAPVLRQWLAAADAGVLPMLDTVGHRGRWPSKLSDYMSAGRPTVLTDVGDVAALVRSHGIGWVSAPDATSLGQALVDAVGAPDRDARGAAAQELAAGELSWRNVAARLSSFYAEVSRQWQAAA